MVPVSCTLIASYIVQSIFLEQIQPLLHETTKDVSKLLFGNLKNNSFERRDLYGRLMNRDVGQFQY